MPRKPQTEPQQDPNSNPEDAQVTPEVSSPVTQASPKPVDKDELPHGAIIETY